MTYDLTHDPEHQEIMTATSHLTGARINRFTHIHHSIDDLVKKVRIMRLLGQKTGTCFQRCVDLDGLNAVYVTTYDIDQRRGATTTSGSRTTCSRCKKTTGCPQAP